MTLQYDWRNYIFDTNVPKFANGIPRQSVAEDWKQNILRQNQQYAVMGLQLELQRVGYMCDVEQDDADPNQVVVVFVDDRTLKGPIESIRHLLLDPRPEAVAWRRQHKYII